MYKPIAENDKNKIRGLMTLYKKAYTVIGIIVGILGISLIPFLNYIIKDNPKVPNLVIIYILFLLNTVISYFFSYKRSIIIADQKEYIVTLYYYIFNFIQVCIQVLILILTRSFILYLLCQIILNFITNITISLKVDSLYPYLNNFSSTELDKETKSSIFKNIKALFLYKIGGVILTGTDNIIISTFIGVTSVGLVSNYNLLIGTIQTLTSKVFSGITASIGNFNTQENSNKKRFMFDTVNFFSFWLFSFCSICFWVLCNPFIDIWLGKEYILNNSILFILILNFYLYGMQNGNWIFRDTIGLFNNSKYVPIIASILNLIISILLANKVGVVGVFWGTAISRLMTGIWFDPYILYRYVFGKENLLKYYKTYMIYFSTTICIGILTSYISNIIFIDNIIISFIYKLIICLAIPNIMYCILFKNTNEYKFLINKVKSVIFSKKI